MPFSMVNIGFIHKKIHTFIHKLCIKVCTMFVNY